MKIVSSPDLNIGTTFASFSSVGNIPVWNDKLLMCVKGILILCVINLIIRCCSAPQPDELSFKLSIIFSIPISVTDDMTNETLLLVMHSGGFLFVGVIALARVDQTLTKTFLLDMSSPLLITLPLDWHFVHTGNLFIYDQFQYLPRFFKIWFVLNEEIQIMFSFNRTHNMI